MKNPIKKISVALGVLGWCLFPYSGIERAEGKDPEYPIKPISFYIGFAAGGAGDLGSRSFIEAAAKYLGQSFIPINRPGAGGSLAATTVMSAKPDGYTLGNTSVSTFFVAPFSGAAPYQDLSGFTMLVNFGSTGYPLAVRSDAPWKSWKEFIEWARKNPKAAKIGIAGARSVTSTGLGLWQVEKREQVEFTYIPLKGTSEILPATLGGHITMFAGTLDGAVVQYIQGGKLRVLAYLGTEKITGHENIPSLQELYGFSIPGLNGVYGPRGLPDYVLNKLDDAFPKAAHDPGFISAMRRLHIPIFFLDRVQTQKYVAEQFQKWGEVMKVLKAEEEKGKN